MIEGWPSLFVYFYVSWNEFFLFLFLVYSKHRKGEATIGVIMKRSRAAIVLLAFVSAILEWLIPIDTGVAWIFMPVSLPVKIALLLGVILQYGRQGAAGSAGKS